MLISELKDGIRINGQFLVFNVAKCVNNNGGNYLNIELRDSSGSISAKKWESNIDDENLYVVGNVVYIEGEVLKYKETLQIKILGGKLVDPNEVDASKFSKLPPIEKSELIKRFNDLIQTIKNPDCLRIIDYFVNKYQKEIFSFPAGISIHHDYSSGLLVHITTMAEIGKKLASLYDANCDLLITGIILHDIGKVIEFEGPVIFKYSLEGKLLGHISIMVSELKVASEKLNINSETILLLEHMVLSHHGEPEFGSPIRPLTKEAMLLSFIDNLDSKMVVANKALENVEPGEFSQKVFTLDNRCLYKPKY